MYFYRKTCKIKFQKSYPREKGVHVVLQLLFIDTVYWLFFKKFISYYPVILSLFGILHLLYIYAATKWTRFVIVYHTKSEFVEAVTFPVW